MQQKNRLMSLQSVPQNPKHPWKVNWNRAKQFFYWTFRQAKKLIRELTLIAANAKSNKVRSTVLNFIFSFAFLKYFENFSFFWPYQVTVLAMHFEGMKNYKIPCCYEADRASFAQFLWSLRLLTFVLYICCITQGVKAFWCCSCWEKWRKKTQREVPQTADVWKKLKFLCLQVKAQAIYTNKSFFGVVFTWMQTHKYTDRWITKSILCVSKIELS